MSIQPSILPIILASASRSRRQILESAGLNFTATNAGVDEDAWKTTMRADGVSARNQAMKLAELKAQKVSLTDVGAKGLVIGCDQMLALEGQILDKPLDMAGAKAHLHKLSGKVHTLETAICVAEAGRIVWRHLAQPRLTVRSLSDAFIEAYLRHSDESIVHTVGAYKLESLGGHIFARIEGDYFSILGLPLLPLLDYFRERGVLLT